MSKFIKFMSATANRTYGFITGIATMLGLVLTGIAVLGMWIVGTHSQAIIEDVEKKSK